MCITKRPGELNSLGLFVFCNNHCHSERYARNLYPYRDKISRFARDDNFFTGPCRNGPPREVGIEHFSPRPLETLTPCNLFSLLFNLEFLSVNLVLVDFVVDDTQAGVKFLGSFSLVATGSFQGLDY